MTELDDRDFELDARLRDYGDRWRTAASDADADDVPTRLDSAGGRELTHVRAGRRPRRVRDTVLAGTAAAAAGALLVVGAIAIDIAHDGRPAPSSPTPSTVPTATPTVVAAPGAPAFLDMDSLDDVTTPVSFALGLDEGAPGLSHVRWTTWTAAHAAGTGRFHPVPCTDSCAIGHVTNSTPATVDLSEVRNGRFTRVVITSVGGGPLADGQPRSMTLVYSDPDHDVEGDWLLTTADPGPLRTVFTDSGEALLRPTRIDFGGSTGAPFVSQLTWTKWGPETAVGVGTYDQRVCVPTCASGKSVHTRLRLTLSGLKDGRFTKASFESLGPEPLPHGSFSMTWGKNAADFPVWTLDS